MNSKRRALGFRTGASAGTALLILVGASLVASGPVGWATLLAALGGVLALGAGAVYRSWRLSVPTGAVAIIFILVLAQFNSEQADLLLQLAGLAMLGAGGALGGVLYRDMSSTIERQAGDLRQKHRAFLAATSDVGADLGGLTASIASQLGADFACLYLASGDARQFVPQPPGVGLERLHPTPVSRQGNGSGPLLTSIESGKTYAGEGNGALKDLFHYLPDDLHVRGALAVPMPVGDHVGGFILLGSKAAGFTEDDRRLAATLALRAGVQLASAHAVAVSQKESARYSLMNGLVKEAAGKTMEEVLELVVERGKEVIRYDAGRGVIFGADGSDALDEPLARVRNGETVLRNAVTEEQHTFSGLRLATHAVTVNEALTPIRAKTGVIGALCLGRRGTSSFSQHDLVSLEELGSMAGVALENSRLLQAVSGQASRLDVALDALGEVSAALTTVTEGPRVLERKILEMAVRITDATAGLLTRRTDEGRQSVIMTLGFPDGVEGMELQNGQGIVGAVMLSMRATAVGDIDASSDLRTPPDLHAYGLVSAVCTPMLEEGQLWGTLSVFDGKKRDWTADDQRVLATLGNQGVVAIRNAELYEKNERIIWELRNLQEALQAATSTLDLNQVLQQLLAGAAKASSAQIGCLALEDPSGKLVLKGGFGTDHVTAERLALGLGGEICGEVMSTGEAVMDAMSTQSSADSPLNPRAVLCVPIKLRGKPLGVVFLANYQVGHTFTADHRNLVTELATQAAVPIDNARLFKDREEVILQSLVALANASDANDPYTAGHSERVTQYSLMIARQMRYAPQDPAAWTRLERGGRLHDIGKIGVPDAVLQKAGKLTDTEFDQMKSHTTIGFNILSGLHMLSDELVIVRSHHERYDGNGYPDRKKGDELPMFAWIVSAADAIDAMTSDRPYRKGMSLDVAVGEVRAGAGTHFHPDVAEAVLDAVANGTLKLIPQRSLHPDAPRIGAFENPVG
ncbi:MAG TPA: GAF domain-containing protein [Candidatus Dormibacteraeota bacterium]|nr:GAF domain-containing protein [Candidatus Dormibacteraeota bacterium]